VLAQVRNTDFRHNHRADFGYFSKPNTHNQDDFYDFWARQGNSQEVLWWVHRVALFDRAIDVIDYVAVSIESIYWVVVYP
jgi:hypothetical protein